MPNKLGDAKRKNPLRILFMRSGGYFNDLLAPDAPMIGPPKSLLYLAGLFKNDHSIRTAMLDVLAYPDFQQIKRERRNPPFYFGMEFAEVAKRVDTFDPQIIAVTCTANYFLNDTVKLINNLKRSFPSLFLVVGGPDATTDYQTYFTKAPAIDVIVLREGEVSFKNLVYAWQAGENWQSLKGIAYREDGQIKVNADQDFIQNLDEYKCDYDIVDFKQYFYLNKKGFPSRLTFKYPGSCRSIDLATSRGCSYDCTFCCINLHMGSKFRSHSASYVLAEMQLLIEKHGIRNFHFEDDNLLCDLERFKEILRGIIKNDWNITWDTPNGVRVDLIDEELVKMCAKSGCTYLSFGLESGSKKVLDKIIKKNLDMERIIQVCKLCFDNEIDTLAFFIFGLPGETKEDLLKTYYFAFDLFKKYNTTPIFQLWRPYKNTPLELAVRDSYNITEQVIFSLHKQYKIPYTLFYSKVYEDEEVTLEFLAYYFEKYLKDASGLAFRNWIKIAQKRPLMLINTFAQSLLIFLLSLFNPSRVRYRLQKYLTSPGIMPFSMLHKRGKKVRQKHR